MNMYTLQNRRQCKSDYRGDHDAEQEIHAILLLNLRILDRILLRNLAFGRISANDGPSASGPVVRFNSYTTTNSKKSSGLRYFRASSRSSSGPMVLMILTPSSKYRPSSPLSR